MSPLLLALLGGAANGTFPVFIKTEAVVAACVHPVIFQLYKSFCVFVLGAALVASRSVFGLEPTYLFSWWGIFSAGAWIPAGLATIVAVPRIGVGSTVLLTSSTASLLSFLVFWLVFGEAVRTHKLTPHGTPLILAPLYIVGMVLGMGGLVWAQQAGGRERIAEEAAALACSAEIECCCAAMSPEPSVRTSLELSDRLTPRACAVADDECCGVKEHPPLAARARAVRRLLGAAVAVGAGILSALQYGMVTYGRKRSEPSAAAGAADERFNPIGSWMLTFGGGALGWSLVTVVLAAIHSETRGSARPLLQLQTIGLHGFAAGSCWCIGNLFNTLAVVAGGNAVVVPISHAASLVTSGAWGLFYYKEIHGQAAIGWGAAAAWTVVMVVLLALEKA